MKLLIAKCVVWGFVGLLLLYFFFLVPYWITGWEGIVYLWSIFLVSGGLVVAIVWAVMVLEEEQARKVEEQNLKARREMEQKDADAVCKFIDAVEQVKKDNNT